MGNNNTKYDAPDGDDSDLSLVCPYDTFSRIRINYVEITDFNGFTIRILNKDIKTNSKDFNIYKVNKFKQLLNTYAKKYVTIFKDIFDLNNDNADNSRNNGNVIQNIKFNEHNDYNEYQVIFGNRIRQIDTNWHEKVYTAFIKYPLVCDTEKITINTNIHTPSKTERRLTQLFSGMIKLGDVGKRRNFNPFEETIEMKVKRNSWSTRQINKETTHLEKRLQHLKIMKIEKVNQGSENEYNLDSVRNTINKKIQHVEDAINQCNVMIDQLKQNTTNIDKYNENILENVFLEEVENKCERIEITQEKFSQTNESICDIVKQVQKIIEYDWKEYNMNIIKQWEEKMMEQLQIIIKMINVVNGVSNCELSDELKLGKLGGMKIGVLNDEHSFTVRLNQFCHLTGDEFRVQVYGNSGTCLHPDSKSFSSNSRLSSSSNSSSSTSDDRSEINEDDTNGKFLSDTSNSCRCWFFIIDDGG